MNSLTKQNSRTVGLLSIVVLFAISVPYSFAESHTTTPLDDDTNLEKTTTIMNIPNDNTLPWATVKGSIVDPAQGHPVIIQFFDGEYDDEPVHVAQVDVKSDDTYEYKFRIRNVNLETGAITDIFQGDYTVKIFKVVNSAQKSPDTF